MKTWLRITLLLCTYGFFREFRPSEPFVSEFLSGEWRDITSEQVTQLVYPVGTYSYLALLIVAFLITDMLRYKPLIVVSACAGIVLWAILLWTTSLGALQSTQFLYGLFMATEVAYYTYIYAKVERDRYQMVTGFTKSAILGGRFLAGAVGQLLVSFNAMDLRELNYITFGSQIISLGWAIALPSVATSVYFHAPPNPAQASVLPTISTASLTETKSIANSTEHIVDAEPTERSRWRDFSCQRATVLLWTHFRDSYSDPVVVQWSIWWALTMCGFNQVQVYVQFLWQAINPNSETIYNGAVEAALTLFGAGSAFAAGFINNGRFDRWSFFILSLVSVFMGGILLWGTLTAHIWISYVSYVLFGTATHFMVTIASINVAKRLKDDSFGLVFGVNTMLALTIQTVLTVIVISEDGFALEPRDQFKVNSGYFVVLGVCYAITGSVQLIYRNGKCCRKKGNVE